MIRGLQELSSRRIILFGGKGGVGKTTVSAAAALHFARTRPTILFTTDPASNLSDIFTSDDQPAGSLKFEELDAVSLYTRFLQEHLDNFIEIGDRGTYLDRDELRRLFELALPGIDEVMAWMRIGELAEGNPDAIVVVDTAPTGHTVRMLDAAGHFRHLAAALDAMEEKHRGMVRQLTRRDVRDSVDAFIDQFRNDAERRRALLTNPQSAAFVPIALSEPLVVEQTIRLIAEVKDDGIDVPFVVLNRVVSDPSCDRDQQRALADEDARSRLGRVVDAPRACFPLDTVEGIRAWSSDGAAPPSAAPLGGKAPKIAAVGGRAPLDTTARLLFFAGKGGVGKTSSATSVALQLAQRNPQHHYTIISVDPAHALRDVFAHEQPPSNLTVETIDTRAKWQRFRETMGSEIERAIDSITPGGLTVAYDTEALQKLIEIAPPGADELFAISRLAKLVADDSQAKIIVDTAPTGHFLRLLELPQSAGDWVREFMRLLLRYRELIPSGSLGGELVNASKSLKQLDAALHSADAAVVIVTRPERIVVAETRRLIDELRRREISVAGVVANYVTPASECLCDSAMRRHELAALETLGSSVTIVHRQDRPPGTLDDLARFLPLASD